MVKSRMTGSQSDRRSLDEVRHSARANEPSVEIRNRLARNRFTYSGGYDGYEGRMILRPDNAKPPGTKR
jgi:hypothetical protein